MSRGSHSAPAAALTLVAIGAAGLVDWPVLLAVGGTALLVHQLSQRSAEDSAATSNSLTERAVELSGDHCTEGQQGARP